MRPQHSNFPTAPGRKPLPEHQGRAWRLPAGDAAPTAATSSAASLAAAAETRQHRQEVRAEVRRQAVLDGE